MNTYDKTISFWNNIFNKNVPKKYIKSIKMNESLENAIYWISDNSRSILDYGCGSGTMLLKCALNNNVVKCVGIDISKEAIKLCEKTANLNNLEGKAKFYCGEIELLGELSENSFDGAILSNIIDNVTPDDAINIIKNIKKIVIPNGKILIKLNPYLDNEILKEYGLQLIDNNFYIEKDGIYLRNLTTNEWTELINKFFYIQEFKEIYFEKFGQYNRLFLLINNK